MCLFTVVKTVSIAALLNTVTLIDWVAPLPPSTNHTTPRFNWVRPAAALPSQRTLVSRRQRLNFRVGVRSSSYRVGGFSRSAACAKDQMLTALVPPPQSQERLSNNKTTVDKTASDRPTFFVYLPALPSQTAQFTLQNEAGTQQLHSVKFKLTGKPGIVGIQLPSSAPALQVGQKYVWQVAVACEPDDSSSSTVIAVGSSGLNHQPFRVRNKWLLWRNRVSGRMR